MPGKDKRLLIECTVYEGTVKTGVPVSGDGESAQKNLAGLIENLNAHITEKAISVLVICSIGLVIKECKGRGQRVYSSAPRGHETLGNCPCPPTESR